ncbi:MAG: prepilin-type N-terminal cleavage/methylation domain-containing protein [Candidatus Omnitrophica bacterium]|nr:prepilin-type N-terminal cleavage/methylation domain-containing protein [Candidatus Omnitrophota bacterium]
MFRKKISFASARAFTPLEKATDEVGGGKNIDAAGGLMPMSAETVRERSSLTGFTLIEIIIALTILGIGLISVMAYLPVALDASRRASDLTKATLLAREWIENVRAAAYDDITKADTKITDFVPSAEYAGFEYKIEINPTGAATFKDVKVTVRWRLKGKLLEESFQTRIAKYNPG